MAYAADDFCCELCSIIMSEGIMSTSQRSLGMHAGGLRSNVRLYIREMRLSTRACVKSEYALICDVRLITRKDGIANQHVFTVHFFCQLLSMIHLGNFINPRRMHREGYSSLFVYALQSTR